jgi:hypothetical protein
MSTRNTLLFGAALAASTAAIAYDHATKPLPPRPVVTAGQAGAAAAPCAAGSVAPCAAGAPATDEAGAKLAAPPPPLKPAEEAPALAAPPPPPKALTSGNEAPDLAVEN